MGATLPVIGFLGLVYIISKIVSRSEPPAQSSPSSQENFSRVEDDSDDKLIEESVKEFVAEKFPVKEFDSPIEGVSSEAWNKYVSLSKKGAGDTITPSYNIGFFLMGQKALADYGYVNNLRKQIYRGKEVLMGSWVSPHSLKSFQKSPAIQYEAFTKYSKDHAKAIDKRYSGFIGKQVSIDGMEYVPTLSGLMAVARRAGLGGLDKWVRGDRKDYTTKMFVEANGIF